MHRDSDQLLCQSTSRPVVAPVQQRLYTEAGKMIQLEVSCKLIACIFCKGHVKLRFLKIIWNEVPDQIQISKSSCAKSFPLSARLSSCETASEALPEAIKSNASSSVASLLPAGVARGARKQPKIRVASLSLRG